MALTLQNSNINSVFSLRNKTKNYNNAIITVNNNNKPSSQIQIPYIPPEIINIILFYLKEDKKSLAASTNEISNRTCQIRHFDLSGFSTIGLQKSNATYKNIINPQCIINILRFCPNLAAFSISESLESTITFELLSVLFYECKDLKMLDFCGCSSKQFATNFTKLAESLGKINITNMINNDGDDDQQVQRYYRFEKVPNNNNQSLLLNHIQRISLHECPSLSEYSTIIPILAHMPNITHLDLGGCAISDATLEFLTYETNATTSLTDLSLAKCKNISSPAISSFISQCQELVTLNLYTDKAVLASITEYDLITMINSSPSTKKLKSLNIGSTNITPRVLYAIQESSSNLKHLGIAKANITDVSQLTEFVNSMPLLEYVDFTSIGCLSFLNTNNGFISGLRKNHPLHTIEMCHNLLKKLRAVEGWKINENYTRRWYYAKDTPNNVRPDRVYISLGLTALKFYILNNTRKQWKISPQFPKIEFQLHGVMCKNIK
ncbi:12793_t:CDS:2 [Entrophospora sp. SA101]|nr:12793_t:CDS:2 [Entrophospora sp. SA101]